MPRLNKPLCWLALLVIVAGHLLVYRAHLARVAGVGNYDSAWYYSVARNFALGRGLTDDIVWQYLAPPATVARAVGEYWGPGWPFLLGLSMRLFGTAQRDALLIVGAISLGLPLVSFVLGSMVRRAAGERSERGDLLVAFFAGLLVALQPRIHQITVVTDVAMPYALASLAAVAIFLRAQRRPRTRGLLIAGVALALPLTLRGDGFVPLIAVLPSLLWCSPGSKSQRLRRLAIVMAGFALVAVPLGVYNFVNFGSPGTAARSQALLMTSYSQFSLLDGGISFDAWWHQGWRALWALRVDRLELHALDGLLNLPLPLWLLAVVGSVVGLRRRDPTVLTLVSFVLACATLPVLAAPIVAAMNRTTSHIAPFVCILAGAGVAAVVRAILRWRHASRLSIALSGATAAALLTGAITWYYPFWLSTHSRFDHLAVFAARPIYAREPQLLAEAGLHRGEVVVSEDAHQTAAFFDVAAVQPPIDGPRQLERVVARYRPTFMFVRRGSRLEGYLRASSIHCRERNHLGDMMLCAIEK